MGTFAAYIYSVFAVIWGRVVDGPKATPVEFFETSALLVTFIALGKLLEGAAKGRTSKVSYVQSKFEKQDGLASHNFAPVIQVSHLARVSCSFRYA